MKQHQSTLILPHNLLSIPSRKFKLDHHSEYYSEDRQFMKQYQMVNFKKLYETFDRFIIFGIECCKGNVLSKLRQLVREYESEWFIGKNTVVKRLITEMINSSPLMEREELENLKQLNNLLIGQIAILFTNKNPTDMIQLVESIKSNRTCKLGELINKDIYLYEGDTLIDAVYDFIFEKCKIPITYSRLQNNYQITIPKTVMFLQENNRVTKHHVELANLLKLEPIECMVSSKYVFERVDRYSYHVNVLQYDLNHSIYEAMNNVGALSLECNLINQMTVIAQLKKSIQNVLIIGDLVE